MTVYPKLARSTLTKSVLSCASRGIPVFPLKGKKPLTPHGFEDASHEASRVTAMFNAAPNATGYGIPTGGFSGLVVVDKDGDSPEAARLWGSLPPTLEVATSRGRHRYYRIPKGAKVRSRKLAPDVDLKADRGYVVAAGSVHPSGARYEFVEETKALGVADLPEELLEPQPVREVSRRRKGVDIDDLDAVQEGMRNQALFFKALELKDAGRSREEALGELLAVNAARCSPPLDEAEVESVVTSAFRYPVRGKKTPPEVMEILTGLKQAWWASAWRGVGGKTERDIVRVLIQWAERYGHLIPAGVRISISWRDLAIASGCGRRTIARVVRRLRARSWLRGDNADRTGAKSGAFVLLPRPTGTTQSIAPLQEGHPAVSGATLSHLPEVTPCFRWSGLVKKGKAGVLYVLEVMGPQGLDEMAERLGFSRPRDLRRLYLEPLAEMGLVEDRGGVYRLPGQERYVERVEDVLAARCGGGPRKVRSKDKRGFMVTRVVEVPPKSELEREEADLLKHEAERDKYRNGKPGPELHVANLEADGYIPELERVPECDPALVAALREFLRRNPDRRDEEPGWFSVALWAEDYLPAKPTLLAVEVALGELRRVAA
jgi:hypothetical protein